MKMKTTMASAALLLVLALAVASAPLTAEAQKKKAESAAGGGTPKAENSYCGTLCDGRKGTDYVVCKDSCDLNEKVNLISHSRIECEEKCRQKGITKEQTVCKEQCGKDYKVKAFEIAVACNKTCELEKFPTLQYGCKLGCTPPP